MERIGPYEVLGELGQGGMARVVRARHQETGAVHALKLLDGATGAEELARFRREAEALSALAGQDVVPVHAVGQERGRAWLAMELMPGGSLRERLRTGPLPRAEALTIVRGLAATLARAHELGLVHRDVKPENVLFDEQGRARLADFGLARDLAVPSTLTASGALLGTPGYLPPEVMRGERAGPAADAFALGVLLHELLSGRRPFAGATAIAQLEATLSGRREPPPSAPQEVLALLDRLLEPDPARRMGLAELARVLEHGPGAPRAPRRVPGLAIAGVLALGLAVLVGVRLAADGPAARPPTESTAPTASPTDPAPDAAPVDPVQDGPARLADWPRGSADLEALAAAAQITAGEPVGLPSLEGLDPQVQQVVEAAAATSELLRALATHAVFFEATGWIPRASGAWRATFARVQLAPAWRQAFGSALVRRLRLEMLPRRRSVHRWSTNEVWPALHVGLVVRPEEAPLLEFLLALGDAREKDRRDSAELARLANAAKVIGPSDPILEAVARLLIAERVITSRAELEQLLADVGALGPHARVREEVEVLIYLRRSCHRQLHQLGGPEALDHLRQALGGGLPGDEVDPERYQLGVAVLARLLEEGEAARVRAWDDQGDAVLLRCRAAAEAISGRLDDAGRLLVQAGDVEREKRVPFGEDGKLPEARRNLEAALEQVLVRAGRRR